MKLGRHISHGERMNSIDFGGHRSNVKVTMALLNNVGCAGMLHLRLFVVIFDFVTFIVTFILKK